MQHVSDQALDRYYWHRYGTKQDNPTHEDKMVEHYKEVKRNDGNQKL